MPADYFSGLGDWLTPAATLRMHTPDQAIAELGFVTKQLGSKVDLFGINITRKLNAIFGSDIGHFDVIDMRHPLPEAHELVEDGQISEVGKKLRRWGSRITGIYRAALTIEQPSSRHNVLHVMAGLVREAIDGDRGMLEMRDPCVR